MVEILFNRTWQKVTFTLFLLLSVPVGGLGVYTLYTSPILSFDQEFPFPVSEHHIRKIEDIELSPPFFMRLPEFFTPQKEATWWQAHEKVYQTITGKASLLVEFEGIGGMNEEVEASVGLMPLTEIIKKMGLVYLVALIYLLSAASVFQKHRSPAGSLLSFFLLAGGIYFISSSPVVNRGITLSPLYFKIFVSLIYIAAGGLITLVHFAFVFPKPKKILQRFPQLPMVLYGYFLLSVTLYLTGVIGFGTTFTLFCFWTFVMIGAFIHSLIKEEDVFLRKQITLSLIAPLITGGAFIFLYLLPGVLGLPSMQLTSFALISLILPFALPSAMDNLHLYQERLEVEKASQREKERIRQELHDSLSNDLTNIRFLAEVGEQSLSCEPEKVRDLLRTIKETALGNMECLRDFLWVIDQEEESLEDVVAHFKSYAMRHLDPHEIEVKLKTPSISRGHYLNTHLRFNLFCIYKEAMTNIIKHSRAKRVEVGFSPKESGMEMWIADDGVGFDPHSNPCRCYGIKHMRKRAQDMGAVLAISSRQGEGTGVRLFLPQIPHLRD